MPTSKELREQAEELLRQADAQLAIEKQEGINKVMKLIDEYQLTADDLPGFMAVQQIAAKKAPKKGTFGVKMPKAVIPPKYRNPETGETWSGRGKEPGWVKDHRDEFLIKEGSEKQQLELA
jgi:DNA-binding protein H-NS